MRDLLELWLLLKDQYNGGYICFLIDNLYFDGKLTAREAKDLKTDLYTQPEECYPETWRDNSNCYDSRRFLILKGCLFSAEEERLMFIDKRIESLNKC